MPDKQVIVQARPDAVISLGSGNLMLKATNKGVGTVLVDFPIAGEAGHHQKMQELTDALRPLTAQSRLYMRGHGDWQNQTVGGVDAATWARTLTNAGLPKIAIISICACQAARDLGTADSFRLTESANSFASKFHGFLKDPGRYEAVVYARIYNVRVIKVGADIGRKHTGGPKDGSENKRAKSKIRLSWDNGEQKREWVDYAHGGTSSIEEDLEINSLMAIDI